MMPNFLIIGTAKAGTDSLNSYLAQHPQIYMSPNKEPMFFVADGQGKIPYHGPGDQAALERWDSWVNTLDRYQALFAGATTEKAVGEASTWYLYDPQAHQRIHQYVPKAKLIAILRNPVDRAYSAFTMLLRDGREEINDFSQALAAEDARVRANWEPIWHYRRMGFYYEQFKRYYDTFDAAQIRVVLYDDFNVSPGMVARDLFRFLEVDDRFEADTSARLNISLVPRNPRYYRFIAGRNIVKTVLKPALPARMRWNIKERFLASNLTRPAPLHPAIRAQLISIFRTDILQLQDLIGRDLSPWLEGS